MSSLPAYVGAITIAGITGILTATCAALYRGSRDSGASRSAAATTAAGAAILFGVWAVASADFAHHGGYHTQLGKQPPWLPIEANSAGKTSASRSFHAVRFLRGRTQLLDMRVMRWGDLAWKMESDPGR
jgi:hypothetical protein